MERFDFFAFTPANPVNRPLSYLNWWLQLPSRYWYPQAHVYGASAGPVLVLIPASVSSLPRKYNSPPCVQSHQTALAQWNSWNQFSRSRLDPLLDWATRILAVTCPGNSILTPKYHFALKQWPLVTRVASALWKYCCTCIVFQIQLFKTLSQFHQCLKVFYKIPFKLKLIETACSPASHWQEQNCCSFCRPPECNGGPAKDTRAYKEAECYSLAEWWTLVGANRVLKHLQNVSMQWTMYTWLYMWRAHGCGCHLRRETRLHCASGACDRMWLRYRDVPKTRDLWSHSRNTGPVQGTRTLTKMAMVSNPLENSHERHKIVTQTISELNLSTINASASDLRQIKTDHKNLGCALIFITFFICHKPEALAVQFVKDVI